MTRRAVIGLITLDVASHRGLVDSPVVSPDHGDEGIEASLLLSILTRAHELGLRELFLSTGNDTAIFEARGFARVEPGEVPSEIRNKLREDCQESAVVMRMLLTTLF